MGPANICSTGGDYNFWNVPQTISATWSATPSNYFVTSAGSGRSAHLVPVNSSVTGVAHITFTPSCGPAYQYTFWVGPPQAVINVNNPIPGYFSTSDMYEFDISPAFFSGHWSVDGGYITSGGDGPSVNINFTVFNNYATVTVTPNNDCGSGDLSLTVLVGSGSCPPGDICPNVIYPNPTGDLLKISLVQPPTEKRPVEALLYDAQSVLVYRETFLGKDFQFSVKSFPEGLYYLNLRREDKTVQRRVEIKH